MNSILSKNEAKRLKALHQYQILDTSPEQTFDDLAFLAAQVCATPIAVINFIDANRQWFKAKIGLDVEEMPIDIGICPHCVAASDVLVIPDTWADERFSTSHVVTSAPYVRFYAGVPLITPEGEAIGALCVVDIVPRPYLKTEQIESLKAIARLVMRQLELRRNLTEVASIKTEYKQAQQALRESESMLRSFFDNPYQTDEASTWLKATVSKIVESSTTAQRFAYIVEDITERKQSEETLRWKEALLRSMTDVSPLAFYVVDHRNGEILYFNERFCEIWNIEHLKIPMEGGGLKHQDVMEVCCQFTDTSPFTACPLLPSETCDCEDELLLKDGRVIRRFSRRIRDENDRYFARLYIFEDITSRQLAEQQIREQAALLDIATDAIIVRDLNNTILFWNKSAENIYGWTAQEAIGRNASEILNREPYPQHSEIFDNVLESGSWQGELQKITKSGKEIIVESRWTLVRDEYSQTKSILVVDTDITHKKQLEKQFLRAQRMESIGTLASGIAHDLNNVLSPILMSVQMLKAKSRDARTQQILAIVENNAKRGADLVKQVLSFARGIEGDRTVLQIKHLILEMKQIVEQTFPKSITIETEVETDLLTVRGDSTQLHQVLMNLCLNARDAMPKGGNLKISAKNIFIDENFVKMYLDAKEGSYIAIALTDTGVGMSNQLLDRIFEPFFTTKEFGKGTGLGLSTVMGIVKGHGGFVTVSSTIDKGTKFKVYIPAVQTVETQQVKDLKVPPGYGECILVVDDEAAIREITKVSLENHNYQVITASDGIEALAIYAQYKNQISAAIIDMMMPNMDGATTICALQKMNPLLSIIAVSGLATSEQIPFEAKSPITAFLPKPYTAQELLQTLHSVIINSDQ
ncbi:PAS domain S-box protein [Scytonema sp. NUACC26]|uniref:hybrid sensor histidine kinase/response regulator n=1 Tax=Scytonema sp. NUACC26 TaxID=3140176 RepID=UPI0034DC79E6